METADKWGVLQVHELQLLSLPCTMHHHANSSPPQQHLSIPHPLMSLYHCKLPVPCIANSWSLINIQQLEQMTWLQVVWVLVRLLGLPLDKILTALSRGLSSAFEHILTSWRLGSECNGVHWNCEICLALHALPCFSCHSVAKTRSTYYLVLHYVTSGTWTLSLVLVVELWYE